MSKMETIRAGSVSVRILETPEGWRLNYYNSAGRRKRTRFGTYDEAVTEARKIADSIARGTQNAVISTKDAVILRGILDMVDNDPAKLLAAVTEYLDRHQNPIDDKHLRKVCDELIEDRRQHSSDSYVRSLKLHYRHLCEDFSGARMSTLTGPRVQKWLSSMKRSPRSRSNYLTSIRTLVSFALSHGYLHEDPLKLVKLPKVRKTGKVSIFTPAEFSKLIENAPDYLLPYVLIGGFAGVRTAEIQRLDWSDVGKEFITVEADKAKTAARRMVPICESLKLWLEVVRKPSGPIVTHKNVGAELSKWIRSDKKLTWRHNALRHSYCSYRLAITQDVAKVALEAGNSPAMLFSNYRELVTTEAAEQWFAIVPTDTALHMPASEVG